MVSSIIITFQDYTLPKFIKYKITSYDNNEWYVNISDDTNKQDHFTINGVKNLKSLLLLNSDTIRVMLTNIVLSNGFVIFNERHIIQYKEIITDLFDIYMAMDVSKRRQELFMRDDRLRQKYLKPIPQIIKKEIMENLS